MEEIDVFNNVWTKVVNDSINIITQILQGKNVPFYVLKNAARKATKKSNAEDSESEEIIGAPIVDVKKHTLFFDTEIKPFAQKIENLLVL